MRNLRLILFFLLIGSASLSGQNQLKTDPLQGVQHVVFLPYENQLCGFDPAVSFEGKNYNQNILIGGKNPYFVPTKSIEKGKSDKILVRFRNLTKNDFSLLEFQLNDSAGIISFNVKDDSTVLLSLPSKKENYYVSSRYKNRLLGQLNVVFYKQLTEQLIVVNLGEKSLGTNDLSTYLNSVYGQANIKLSIIQSTHFSDSTYNSETIFHNPSRDNNHYTQQMRDLRDAYFSANPSANKNAYYIFIVKGFTNKDINEYMAKNKAMAFVKSTEATTFYRSVARTLGFGIGMLANSWDVYGPKKGTTLNLMDENGGTELTFTQWESLRHSSNSFSFYDVDEDVRTNNGLVAYYFWEENADGNIILNGEHPLNLIRRPYKKNYLSFHLNIQDVLFEILFKIGDYFICWWHIISLTFFTLFYFSFRIILWWRRRKAVDKPGLFKRKLINWPVLAASAGLCLLSFQLINAQFVKYEVTSGLIQDFEGHSIGKVSKGIIQNKSLKHRKEEHLMSEILKKKDRNWYVKQRKKVVYFNVYQDSLGVNTFCKYTGDSDSLILFKSKYHDIAASHYLVFSFYNQHDSLTDQKAYNHLGVEVSNKLKAKDQAKRILLFVNGYRPTSVGHSFEGQFKDIKSNGLEFPDSYNLIHSFDRYDYWRPWKEIDLLFQRRINPVESYYADGHFSVSTSNYESLINFTTLTAQYPKRCPNPKKHTCYKMEMKSTGIFGAKEKDFYKMLPTKPNKKGFRTREKNGRIAARNLLMMLNEIPNHSNNDTLYIVAHSMGYAYSLGMIDELRGKIHFGGFYIIAPENASQGIVNIEEWQEVWQYGSKWNEKEKDAPCLQDGVAPQICAGGLNENYRIYIPDKYYRRKGFFDSHFVGYYTWIFGLNENKKGYIKQR